MRQSLILQPFVDSPTSQLILQPFRRFTYVTVRSTTVPLLHLRHRHNLLHSSFSNSSAASSTSQLILQPFHCYTYVIGTSPTSHGETPMSIWWCLIYPWWFCNICNDRGPQGYMKDVNLPSNSKGWWPLLYGKNRMLNKPPQEKIRWGSTTLCQHCSHILRREISCKMDQKRINIHDMACQITNPNTT